MSKKLKNLELKKQFDEMIYEIVRSRTLHPTEEVDNLIVKISPQIDKINNILNDKILRAWYQFFLDKLFSSFKIVYNSLF